MVRYPLKLKQTAAPATRHEIQSLTSESIPPRNDVSTSSSLSADFRVPFSMQPLLPAYTHTSKQENKRRTFGFRLEKSLIKDHDITHIAMLWKTLVQSLINREERKFMAPTFFFLRKALSSSSYSFTAFGFCRMIRHFDAA